MVCTPPPPPHTHTTPKWVNKWWHRSGENSYFVKYLRRRNVSIDAMELGWKMSSIQTTGLEKLIHGNREQYQMQWDRMDKDKLTPCHLFRS